MITARSKLNHGPRSRLSHGWLWPFWSPWVHGGLTVSWRWAHRGLTVSNHGGHFFFSWAPLHKCQNRFSRTGCHRDKVTYVVQASYKWSRGTLSTLLNADNDKGPCVRNKSHDDVMERWVSPHKGPVLRSYGVFAVVFVNRKWLLNKQSSCHWFETLWCSCDIITMTFAYYLPARNPTIAAHVVSGLTEKKISTNINIEFCQLRLSNFKK